MSASKSGLKFLIGPKQMQVYMKSEGFYRGKIDGLFGPKSIRAAELTLAAANIGASGWSLPRIIIGVTQLMFVDLGLQPGMIDGHDGPNTQRALEDYQNRMRAIAASEEERSQANTQWPLYKDMERFYGPVGQNIAAYRTPYPMYLAWDTETLVTRISLHQKCASSALGVLEAARDHYTLRGISEHRLDLFGGSLNVRKMRGGNDYSTHAWAAAMDIDPLHNQFRWNHTLASLDDDAYDKWWELWEAEGWVSLGRERNYDWMHVQAVRI